MLGILVFISKIYNINNMTRNNSIPLKQDIINRKKNRKIVLVKSLTILQVNIHDQNQ